VLSGCTYYRATVSDMCLVVLLRPVASGGGVREVRAPPPKVWAPTRDCAPCDSRHYSSLEILRFLLTTVVQNCYLQMRFLGSQCHRNASWAPWDTHNAMKCVKVVQGHRRSLISLPIESAYANNVIISSRPGLDLSSYCYTQGRAGSVFRISHADQRIDNVEWSRPD